MVQGCIGSIREGEKKKRSQGIYLGHPLWPLASQQLKNNRELIIQNTSFNKLASILLCVQQPPLQCSPSQQLLLCLPSCNRPSIHLLQISLSTSLWLVFSLEPLDYELNSSAIPNLYARIATTQARDQYVFLRVFNLGFH